MKVLAVLLALAVLAAGWLAWDRLKANARADVLVEAFERSDSTFSAYRDSVTAERAARDVEMASGLEAADRAAAAASALEAEANRSAGRRRALAAAVDAAIIDTAVAELVAAERASFGLELSLVRDANDSLRVSNDSLRLVILLGGRQIASLNSELQIVDARLADALAGWESSERARRPSLVTRATQVLAVIGLTAVADRAFCGVTGNQLLLPCGS